MIFDKRIFIIFITNIILVHLMILINSGITFTSFNLFIIGPIYILAPLYLRTRHFFICAFLTGLWVDAAIPSPYGLITTSMVCIGTFIHLLRLRFRAEENFHPIILSHLSNFICATLVLCTSVNSIRGFLDLLFLSSIELLTSHLILMLIAPWFFNLQRSLFRLMKSKVEPDSLPFG